MNEITCSQLHATDMTSTLNGTSVVSAENFQFPCNSTLRDHKAFVRISQNLMGLNNELKALRGCDFHAWKQI